MALGERQITVDCDVLQADGGTRCAAITGGWVALRLAVNALMAKGRRQDRPARRDHVAAVSCGIYGGVPVLDLDYAEDSVAGTDANFVMTGDLAADRGAGQRRGRDLLPSAELLTGCSISRGRRRRRRWSPAQAAAVG